MNILPKKRLVLLIFILFYFNTINSNFFRWHVRNKDNIARVRKDEANAAAEEKEKLRRAHKADQETRLNILRKRAREDNEEATVSEAPKAKSSKGLAVQCYDENIRITALHSEIKERLDKKDHVNFFNDAEENTDGNVKANKEHDEEAKEEKEKYEKQIGYLTYLGQDTNEALGKRNWYDVLPERHTGGLRPDYVKDTYDKLIIKDIEGNVTNKEIPVKGEIVSNWKRENDPLNIIKRQLNLGREIEKLQKKDTDNAALPTVQVQKRPRIDDYDPIVYKKMKKDKKKDHKSKKSKKHKKRKRSKHSSEDSISSDDSNKSEKNKKLEVLRQERLRREMEEKGKAEALLARLSGKPIVAVKSAQDNNTKHPVKQKYNSQFNPEIAKQNYETYYR